MLSIPKLAGYIKLTAGSEITASADLAGINHVIVLARCLATAAAQTCTLYVYGMDTNTSGTASTYLTTLWGTSQMVAQGDVGTTVLNYMASVNVASKGRYLLAHVKNGAVGTFAQLDILGFRRENMAQDVTTLGVTKFAQS